MFGSRYMTALRLMQRNVASKVGKLAFIALAFYDAEGAFALEMHLHVGEFEDDFADTVRIAVIFLVWTAQYHLVEKLSDKLVTLLEASMSALRTGISDPLRTRATQCLITL